MINKPKMYYENTSSASNKHNCCLDCEEVQQILKQKSCILPFRIQNGLLEWFIRTLADEIYKLQFISPDIYNRIKIFYPGHYEFYQRENQLDFITKYLEQFQNFDLEDYFDVIIITYFDTGNKTLIFNCYLNSFTYLVDEKENKNFSNKQGFELFYERKVQIKLNNEFDLSIFVDIVNLLLKDYIYKYNVKSIQQIKLSQEVILNRIIPILKEETLVILYELYKDL